MKQKLSTYLATGLIALVGVLPFAIVGLSVTGCSTIGSGGGAGIITPARVKAVAYLGTAFALTTHPEYRTGFTLAVAELKFLETQDKIDFATFLAIVHKFPVKELEGQNGILYITAATLLLDDLGGSLDLSKVEKVKPYVTALREGIELGLGTPPPSASLRPSVEQRLSALEEKAKPALNPWGNIVFETTLEVKPWQHQLMHITTNTLEWNGDSRFVLTP